MGFDVGAVFFGVAADVGGRCFGAGAVSGRGDANVSGPGCGLCGRGGVGGPGEDWQREEQGE